jgi:hypothetical protein
VIERFRDSDGLIQHGENLAHLMDAIIATGSVSGELLGEPSAELGARIRAGARCSSSRRGRGCSGLGIAHTSGAQYPGPQPHTRRTDRRVASLLAADHGSSDVKLDVWSTNGAGESHDGSGGGPACGGCSDIDRISA